MARVAATHRPDPPMRNGGTDATHGFPGHGVPPIVDRPRRESSILMVSGRRVVRPAHSNSKETTCQDESVISAGKTNLCRVARPVRKVISHARTARTAMNTASSAGIRSDSSER